jgi:hypothetical protein
MEVKTTWLKRCGFCLAAAGLSLTLTFGSISDAHAAAEYVNPHSDEIQFEGTSGWINGGKYFDFDGKDDNITGKLFFNKEGVAEVIFDIYDEHGNLVRTHHKLATEPPNPGGSDFVGYNFYPKLKAGKYRIMVKRTTGLGMGWVNY